MEIKITNPYICMMHVIENLAWYSRHFYNKYKKKADWYAYTLTYSQKNITWKQKVD